MSACSNPSPSRSVTYFLNLILCLIRSFVAGSGDQSVNVTLTGGGSGSTQTAAWTSHTANTTVAAGATQVEFDLSADFVGTIGGVAYSGADWAVIGPVVSAPGSTLAAIAVTRSAGTIKILRVAA